MRVVHLGLWKVKENADPAMLARARQKVEAFRRTVPGCIEATLGPLYLPEMGKDDQDTFGNLGDWKQMARGYNYLLYTVWESEAARQNYEEHPAHMALQEECLAVWIGDASESALVFDLRIP